MSEEMPEWLKVKDKLHELHGLKFNESGLSVFLLGAKKCFELMSERMKPRPIETLKDSKTVMAKLDGFWTQGYLLEMHDQEGFEFFSEVDSSTHNLKSIDVWLPLPEVEDGEWI